jgi:two-component sensor histidine kinase
MSRLSYTTTRRDWLIHILCWGIVVFLPLLLFTPSDSVEVTLLRWLRSLGSPLCYMALFYLNYFWLIPRFYLGNRKKVFFAINVVAIIVMVLVMTQWWHVFNQLLASSEPSRPPRAPQPMHYMRYFYNAVSLVLVVGLSLAVRMTQRWQHIEQARKEAERSRTEAELSNLRNQLNPHFLLNTLNNIYALIAFDTEKAQMAVDELSKLLRHVLYDNQENFVPLYKEVAFMQNYVELMKIRVTKGVKITTDIDIAPDNATPIAPLIFISLIENAFKHGIAPDGTGTIHIAMHENDGHITCEIVNSNHPKRANDKSGSGIGLEQVAKRLQLLYDGHYDWQRGTRNNNSEYFSRIELDVNHINPLTDEQR